MGYVGNEIAETGTDDLGLRALPIGTFIAEADGTGWIWTSYDFQILTKRSKSTTSMARAYWPNTRPEHHPRTVVELDVDDPAGVAPQALNFCGTVERQL
ncbi:hypothetical protein ACFVWF_20820 [Rhodococcus qingshengii]|uniref:hypothetical protein n=1 Tax=Rhodococcus qingshengii TaxID=334542 RepID=UPI0036DA7C89